MKPKNQVHDYKIVSLKILSCNNFLGVTVIESCTVKKVNQEDGKVTSVDTDLGLIQCEYFVNCAGFWARGVGQLSEPFVKVPIHAVEHYYLHTKPIPGLDPLTPGNLVMCFKLIKITRCKRA